jgi:hypothetical protein
MQPGAISVTVPLQTRCDRTTLLCERFAAIFRFVSSCRTITDIAKICTRWYGYARHCSILSTSSCHSTVQKDSVEKKEGAKAANKLEDILESLSLILSLPVGARPPRSSCTCCIVPSQVPALPYAQVEEVTGQMETSRCSATIIF